MVRKKNRKSALICKFAIGGEERLILELLCLGFEQIVCFDKVNKEQKQIIFLQHYTILSFFKNLGSLNSSNSELLFLWFSFDFDLQHTTKLIFRFRLIWTNNQYF